MQKTEFDTTALCASINTRLDTLQNYVKLIEARGFVTRDFYDMGRSLGLLNGMETIGYESLDSEATMLSQGATEVLMSMRDELAEHMAKLLKKASDHVDEADAKIKVKEKRGFFGLGKPKKFRIIDVGQGKELISAIQATAVLLDEGLKVINAGPSHIKDHKAMLAVTHTFINKVNSVKWPWGKIMLSFNDDRDTYNLDFEPDWAFHSDLITKHLDEGTLDEKGWNQGALSSMARTFTSMRNALDGISKDYQAALDKSRAIHTEETSADYVRACNFVTAFMSTAIKAYFNTAYRLILEVYAKT